MANLKRLIQQQGGQQRSQPKPVQLPFGGINRNSQVGSLRPNEALHCLNFLPVDGKMKVRNGYRVLKWQRTTPVSIVGYDLPGYSGMLAVDSDGWVLSFNDADTMSVIALNAGLSPAKQLSAAINSATLCIVDGTNAGIKHFNGVTLSSAVLTGTYASNVWAGITAHQNRLYLWKAGSLDFWYLGTDAIQGEPTLFELSFLGRLTGSIKFIGSWTTDAGQGVNDLLVIVTDTGMAAVYEGSDPGDALNWRLNGVYQMSEVVGADAWANVAGDMRIATKQGVVSAGEMLRAGELAAAATAAPSRGVIPLFKESAEVDEIGYNEVAKIGWFSQVSAENSNWRRIAWSPELGLFVTVATAGTNRVMTSPDGETWTVRSASAASAWLDVCWSPELGLFCAVADSNSGLAQIMTSPDGVTWTSRTTPAAVNWRSVCWSPELSLFCAVADSAGVAATKVMTSPDGITWTSRTAAADLSWRGVCWAAELGLFVACAYSGTGNRVMTSPDGTTWTSRTSAGNYNWGSVCWSPELELLVTVSTSANTSAVMTSPDGIVWTLRTTPNSNEWRDVCWAAEVGLFVAVSETGTGNRVMVSDDGITWTEQISAADNSWYGIAWSPELGIFAASAYSGTGNRIMTSNILLDRRERYWQSFVAPDGDGVWFNMPLAGSSRQVVFATATARPFEFDLPAVEFARNKRSLWFATRSGNICKYDGFSDGGSPIVSEWHSDWKPTGGMGGGIDGIRYSFNCENGIAMVVSVLADYRESEDAIDEVEQEWLIQNVDGVADEELPIAGIGETLQFRLLIDNNEFEEIQWTATHIRVAGTALSR